MRQSGGPEPLESRLQRARLHYHAGVPGPCRDFIKTELPCGIGTRLIRRISLHG